MIALIASIVGEKAAKPIFFGLLALILVIIIFVAIRCAPLDHTAERQAEQTTASGDAIANAAQDAISTIGNRTATDAAIDDATASTLKDIDHAQDPDAIRAAVLAGVCGQTSHRHDPACAVR